MIHMRANRDGAMSKRRRRRTKANKLEGIFAYASFGWQPRGWLLQILVEPGDCLVQPAGLVLRPNEKVAFAGIDHKLGRDTQGP